MTITKARLSNRAARPLVRRPSLRRLSRLLGAATLLALAAGTARAEDLALIVGNSHYDNLPTVGSANDTGRLADKFRARGFRVLSVSDANAANLKAAADNFLSNANSADRLVVVLNGQFVHTAYGSWLLPIDADKTLTLADMPRTGLPLRLLYPALAAHPGYAVLALGQGNASDSTDAGTYLAWGAQTKDLPQGVTLFRGDSSAIDWFASTALTVPGTNLTEAASHLSGITSSGYLPPNFVFLPQDNGNTGSQSADRAESQDWAASQRADTIASYRDYLSRHPNGAHADQARRTIRQIQSQPNRDAQQAEQALNLSRDERRQVQRDLSLLGFDPHGIDGLFGPGTRSALTDWQKKYAHNPTGYLTQAQLGQLRSQAQARNAELEKQAAARQAQQRQQDNAYWDQTGSSGTEAGLHAYLDRYPDGIHADQAQQELDRIQRNNRNQADRQVRRAWDQAQNQDTIGAYRDFLNNYGNSPFTAQARARIRELQNQQANSQAQKQAQATEQAMGLSPATRLLVEQRLAAAGLNPGAVDGNFDANTRRALRQYQSARGLPATGYMNQATAVRLLADALLGGH